MKKILAAATSIVLALTLSTTVWALQDHTIPGEGYVGLGEDFDPETLISVQVPSRFYWYATEETNYQVQSPTHAIENKSTRTSVKVTLKSFQQSSGNPINDLTLNLTGDLAADNIGTINLNTAGGFTGSTPYTTPLGVGKTWTFGFGGGYSAGIKPLVPHMPEYNMILNFDLHSVLPPTP